MNIVFKYHFSNQNLSNSIIHANGVQESMTESKTCLKILNKNFVINI